MKRPSPSLRRVLGLGFLSALTLAVGLWAVWSLAGLHFRNVIDGWIAVGRASGYEISFDDRQVFGFPRHITMRLTNLHWKNADGIDFRTDDMDISATPWHWQSFDAKFKHHVQLTAPLDEDGHALTLGGSEGLAHVELDNEGVWKRARVSLADARLGLAPAYLFLAEKLTAAAERPNVPPKDHTQPGLILQGEADELVLPDAMPSPFGTKAERVTAHMRVMGRVPDVRRRASVDAWNKESGIVEFDDLSVAWGVLHMASKGTVGFDDDLQPEGAFAGTFANPKETMQSLIDHGFIAMHDAGMLTAAMDLFAKPSERGAAKGMELPITVQLGGLFFGPIRIFTFPEIEWPEEPPAASAVQ